MTKHNTNRFILPLLPDLKRALFHVVISGLFITSAQSHAEPVTAGNRLAYLDSENPFWPGLEMPKFTTPQWIGDKDVEAVVIFAIDDMKAPGPYEEFSRTLIDRLKRIDGRGAVSIMTNKVEPAHPHFQQFLKEGVSLEAHSLTHPCPLLAGTNFQAGADSFHKGVDMLFAIPENRPVAYRMPCCDSLNTPSPRFYAEIFPKTSEQGRWLAIDSSVMNIPTPADKTIPAELVQEADGRERFRKYFPSEMAPGRQATLETFATTIENYPYPYVINNVCWEFPCAIPSDWEAFNYYGKNADPGFLEDWKKALDIAVAKKGQMTTVHHPYGWCTPEQLVQFVDYAVEKYGKKVKFITFKEALAALEKNALGGWSLRDSKGGDNGVRIMDVNHDGFMDVVIGIKGRQITRVWNPKADKWDETATPFEIINGLKFTVIHGNGLCSVIASQGRKDAWTFREGKWTKDDALLKGIEEVKLVREDGRDNGVRFLDFDKDGRCELLVSNAGGNKVFGWDVEAKQWKPREYSIPEGVAMVDADGKYNGLAFVDLNQDGFDDIVQSNESGSLVYLWAANVKSDLGWKAGWPHEVRNTKQKGDYGTMTGPTLPPFTMDGENAGLWFTRDSIYIQNEWTAHIDGKAWHRKFKDIIAFELPPAKNPTEAAAALKRRPGFKAELAVGEPEIVAPVAFDWDAQGRMWVVEMRDYPSGMDGKDKPGGTVRCVEDTDKDGYYEKSTVFIEGLPYPTGVIAWRNGVIIMAVPDIIYAEDTDGDGRADNKTVLFTGFKPGNQQHRANGFAMGLDGWIYGGNGDSGGVISGQSLNKDRKSRPEVDISGRDFRFRPDTGEFEAASGNAQYGRQRDDWDNWFANHNSTWLWHYSFEEHYLRRNPNLAIKGVKQMLANYPDRDRVFPAGDIGTRFNDAHRMGHVTGACSVAAYRDDLFGAGFATSVFVCEPVYSLVHREVLTPDGATFTSKRADDEQQSEFLGSTDPWFRPVYLKTGPDGALYVADMARYVLEHPEWIAPETQARIDLRAGENLGRIYRIFPEGTKPRPVIDLSKMGNEDLVLAMDSPNGWQRDTAQRLLYERDAKKETEKLASLVVKSTNPKVRVQALATLAMMHSLSLKHLQPAFADKDALVREYAVRVSEQAYKPESLPAPGIPPGENAVNLLAPLLDDPDFRVRRQLALTLGTWNKEPKALELLNRLIEKDGANPQMRPAIISSLPPDMPIPEALKDKPAAVQAKIEQPVTTSSNPDRAKIVADYLKKVGELKGDANKGREVFKTSCALCHKLKNEGRELGPELGMVGGKPLDWLLTAIFDPNAAIEDRYKATMVEMKDGGALMGVVSAETTNSITLRPPGGEETPVLRTNIKSMKKMDQSLMPAGLEGALTPQQTADLVEWIRKP